MPTIGCDSLVKILVISPIYKIDYHKYIEKKDDISDKYKKTGVIIHHTYLPGKGEVHIPLCRVEAFYHTDLLKTVKKAEKEGYDAVVINCASDPELEEARSLVKIPVVAPLEASAYVASMLGRRFSVILNRKARLHYRQDKLRSYGIEHKISSYKIADIKYPSEKVIKEAMEVDNPKIQNILHNAFNEAMKNSVQKLAKEAKEEDGACALILTCTAFSSFQKEINSISKKIGIPILDPLFISIRIAEILAELKC